MNDAYLIPHPGRAVAPLSSTTARSSARRATPPENSLVDLGVAAVRVIALSTRMALSTLGALADAAGPLVRDPLVADVIALARTVGVEVVRAVGLAGVEEPADLLAVRSELAIVLRASLIRASPSARAGILSLPGGGTKPLGGDLGLLEHGVEVGVVAPLAPQALETGDFGIVEPIL
jgi:energy-converting hydrogenase Eha subunit E